MGDFFVFRNLNIAFNLNSYIFYLLYNYFLILLAPSLYYHFLSRNPLIFYPLKSQERSFAQLNVPFGTFHEILQFSHKLNQFCL